MPVPPPPRQRRSAEGARSSPALAAVALSVAALGVAVVAALAPTTARAWALGTAIAGFGCVAAVAGSASRMLLRARRRAAARAEELELVRQNWTQHSAGTAQLVNVTLPAVTQQLHSGASADEVLSRVAVPSDPLQSRLLHLVVTELAESVRRGDEAQASEQAARGELAQGTAELERLTGETLPTAMALLREGSSADTVLARFDWPRSPLLQGSAEWFVRQLAYSERRSAAAQAASVKALSRVQAKTVSMLAALREMQDRHTGEVFGDLLRLDHSTSQLGLMTDRLALLMGGRPSRVWNKPIVMESILRGAVGRIAAYRRVRLHSSSRAAIAGFAAEGVMHLLAELMDNAANFSPPIDEVHVYVEERSAGVVITIEDSGLKMSDAALRRAKDAVSGEITDLASLQGTRLGLAVVGRIAAKYGISVNYRPSSRGGTGVVVLVPPQLVAQQREPVAAEAGLPAPATETPLPVRQAPIPSPDGAPGPRADVPRRRAATPNGLPVRSPGRTMAEAERSRNEPAPGSPAAEADQGRVARDAGSRFGAFHRGRQGAADPAATPGADHRPDATADD
ncbi:ATP-binding protein [Streptomyces sp. NPDC028635]|uniref:sensor histidine kinase n=1 Tax=Streptomyces sp. NPDC028635 TaxID=3154800 RepID=UPI0033D3A5E4